MAISIELPEAILRSALDVAEHSLKRQIANASARPIIKQALEQELADIIKAKATIKPTK